MEIILDFISTLAFIGIMIYLYYKSKTTTQEDEDPWKHIDDTSYIAYSNFYGEKAKNDATFQDKVNKIYNLIVKEKCDDIKFIAKETGCYYQECIIKINYLKHHNLISQDYYVDHINGYIKKCNKKDLTLLRKYTGFLYKHKLQIRDIAVKLPQTTSSKIPEAMETVRKEVKYLIEKDLIEGVIYNEVDDTLIYFMDNTYGKDLITKDCPNCGADIELQRGGKARCEYCNCIVEDDEKRIIEKTK